MTIKKMFFFFGLLFLAKNAIAFTSTQQEVSAHDNIGKLRLIGSYYNEQNQEKIILGLHFKLNDGWKIYGKDANGMGLPPKLDFKGSKNIKNHEILWPQAHIKQEKIGDEVIEYGIYENEVILPIEITAQDPSKPLEISLQVNYGLCKDVCIPAANNFILTTDKKIDEANLQLIQKFLTKEIIEIAPAENDKYDNSKTLISALIAATLGGLILNIMPCVLPVLGIKVMSVVNHGNARINRVRLAFFATIIGIISCFLIFASFAAIISYTGSVFNWGLQFQNPYFLLFLIIVLVIFIANMLGFFELTFDQFVTNFLNKEITRRQKRKRQIFIPNFLSGVLAVLLATPCSAPFLGSAISFSIMQDTNIIYMLFSAMALGFALPYIIFMISPLLIRKLPKPGIWMLRVKEIMAFLLAATVLWLIYILKNNIGNNAAALASIFSLLLLVSFKIKFKFVRIIAFTVVIAAIFALPATFIKNEIPKINPMDRVWKNFDENELHNLVAQGKTIVVDVTADWCLTCKFNKINVLHDKEVIDKLSQDNVIAMRADITTPNQAVISFINNNGRFAIPFNAVYGPNAKDGLLTNELLSKKELLQLIDKVQ